MIDPITRHIIFASPRSEDMQLVARLLNNSVAATGKIKYAFAPEEARFLLEHNPTDVFLYAGLPADLPAWLPESNREAKPIPVIMLAEAENRDFCAAAPTSEVCQVLLKDELTAPVLQQAIAHSTKALSQPEDTVAKGIEWEQELSSLAETAPALLWATNTQGARVYFNRQWLDFTGCELADEQHNGWLLRVHPEDVAYILDHSASAYAEREQFSVEYRLRRRDGTYRWLLDTGTPHYDSTGQFTGYVGASIDITERRLREEAIRQEAEKSRQSPKLEGIGKLAGSMAHEFNTLMAVIMLHTDLMLNKFGTDNALFRHIREIKSTTERATALTQQLLAFSRKQNLQPRPLNLNGIIKEILGHLRDVTGPQIDIDLQLDAALSPVMADPDQMAQVIINLTHNSRDAMPQGGKLTIHTEMETVTKTNAGHEAFAPGVYVKLTLSDTGNGIAPEAQNRIFEPFFSVKEIGSKGAGLGLSMVYGIVKQSGGYIWLRSEPQQGASFSVYLPAVATAPATTHAHHSETQAQLSIFSGAETILIVEDEKFVRESTREVLKVLGYNVLEASDASGALQLAREYRKPIHLLLTDVILPGLNGKELVEQIRQTRPNIKVILMSGYVDENDPTLGLTRLNASFIRKPFAPLKLAQKVRQLLGAAVS